MNNEIEHILKEAKKAATLSIDSKNNSISLQGIMRDTLRPIVNYYEYKVYEELLTNDKYREYFDIGTEDDNKLYYMYFIDELISNLFLYREDLKEGFFNIISDRLKQPTDISMLRYNNFMYEACNKNNELYVDLLIKLIKNDKNIKFDRLELNRAYRLKLNSLEGEKGNNTRFKLFTTLISVVTRTKNKDALKLIIEDDELFTNTICRDIDNNLFPPGEGALLRRVGYGTEYRYSTINGAPVELDDDDLKMIFEKRKNDLFNDSSKMYYIENHIIYTDYLTDKEKEDLIYRAIDEDLVYRSLERGNPKLIDMLLVYDCYTKIIESNKDLKDRVDAYLVMRKITE